jgi:DNA-binding NtrC family response regulator
MKQISIKLSDGLYKELIKIKNELELHEKVPIKINDMIEEAILSYYNISISDINKVKFEVSLNNVTNDQKKTYYNNIDFSGLYGNIQQMILDALNENSRTVEEAAFVLRMSLRTLYRKLKKYNIKKDRITKTWKIKK